MSEEKIVVLHDRLNILHLPPLSPLSTPIESESQSESDSEPDTETGPETEPVSESEPELESQSEDEPAPVLWRRRCCHTNQPILIQSLPLIIPQPPRELDTTVPVSVINHTHLKAILTTH